MQQNRSPSMMNDIGANEAPDINPKMFINPDPGQHMGILQGHGGMPELPTGGAQLPQQLQQPQQGGLPQPQGQMGQVQPPQQQQPEGNMLNMTHQGQMMGAMQPPQQTGHGQPPPRMATGGTAKAANAAIAKAAGQAGMKAPVAANDLTNITDFKTGLMDGVAKRSQEMKDAMGKMDFKYDKGHRVFTDWTAKNNHPPYEIIGKVLAGNQPIWKRNASGSPIGHEKDPLTGKSKRTPIEPGYRVKHKIGEEEHQYDIPQSAIRGHIDEEDSYKKGGNVKPKKIHMTKSIDIMKIEIMNNKGKR